MCIAQSNTENKELSYLRKLCWTIISGYADPKKMPADERAWWPLKNDPKPKAISVDRMKELNANFKSLTFKIK